MNELSPLIDWLGKLGPFGLLLVVCWLVFTGKLVLKREIDREKERTAEERAERIKAEAALDQGRPVIEAAINALNRTPEAVKAVVETAEVVAKQKDGARQ
jgi:Na+-transporting methylmalonyl-CoA/oxaloacetate decarboxylase gamma subunit